MTKLSNMFVDYEKNILKEYLFSIDHHQQSKGLSGFMDLNQTENFKFGPSNNKVKVNTS